MAKELKIGQRVRLKEVDGLDEETIGTVGVILDYVPDECGPQKWLFKADTEMKGLHTGDGRMPDGYGAWVTPEEVELLPDYEFKVGDKVRVITDCYGERQQGAEGEIIKDRLGEAFSHRFVIRFTGGTPQLWPTNSYNASDLELIEKKKKVYKFAVGDKVIYSDWDDEKLAEVTYIDEYDDYLTYKVTYVGGWEWASEDELKAAPKGQFIVISRCKTGRLTLAMNPFVHDSRESAEKEAVRLATLNRDLDFTVFQMVSVAEAPVVPASVIKKVA